MKKKLTISIILASLITVITIVHVIAGASYEYGELSGTPPEGAVNWVAWHEGVEIDPNFPWELLTEDNTNFELGEDLGYSNFDDDPEIEWWMQIEHFETLPRSTQYTKEEIYLIFGGLGETYSGTLWKQTLLEWIKTEFASYWGIAPIISNDPLNACPAISDQPVEEPVDPSYGRTFTFSGPESGATYHIYRSRNGSGAGNDASNGQYFYIDTVLVPEGEYGTFYTDFEVFDGPAWYLVIKANPSTNEIIGCHSEEADPTGVRVFDFDAVYNPDTRAVDLGWKKSDPTIIGFNVFRGTDENVGNAVKINPTQIDAMTEESFTFEDADIIIGETYYYWIELVDNQSRIEKVGPRDVRVGFSIFLPIISD